MSSHSLFASVLVIAACGGDSPSDPSPTVDANESHVSVDAPPSICDQAKQHSDFAFIKEHVLTPSCAKSMCHTGPEPEVGLDLSAANAYSNLVNKGASTVTDWMRVVPGMPSKSYLVVSLGRADGPAPRDGFMPLGTEPLCTEKLQAIERWIAAGAMP